MNGLALFLVLVVARGVVIWDRAVIWTPSFLLACVSQDAIVAAVFLAGEFAVRRTRSGAIAASSTFWLIVCYAAVNVVVARAFSTPLTWPMLRAAGGPISDSIRFYLNWRSLVLMAVPIVAAIVFRRLRHLVPRRAEWLAAGLVAVVGAMGMLAARHTDTYGLHRNAIAVLVAGAFPAIQARAVERDWRRPPLETEPAADLRAFAGLGAGKNVVLIGLESTGAEYLRTFGAAENVMPRLDELAQSAIVFDRAYAVSPDSIRSLFSVLCSRYPAFDTTPEAYEAAPCASIAGALRAAGYRTAMFHSGRFGYLGMEFVIRQRGFELLEDAGDIGGNRESSFGVDEPAAVSRMLKWIDGLRTGERFFLNYLPVAGHHPYESPAPGAFGTATDLERYKSALHDGDRSLGTFIDGLRERGLYDDTLFVIYGDHGQAFGQHDGNFGHTFFLYEENVRVPLLIALPGVLRSPVRSDAVVSLVDLAPTVADVIGLPYDGRRQGSSALDGQRRMALFFTDYGENLVGLRDGRWKFVHALGSPRASLFDMERDPGETLNVSGDNTDRVEAYREILEAWSASEKSRLRSTLYSADGP